MQKKVGNALYVFDTTPFTITEDTDAEVIYVQQEYLKGYLELNTELESKIKTFNQWLLCVNAPWADSGTPDPGPGPEPTPDYHLLTLSDTNNIYLTGYDHALLPGDNSNDWFSVINEAQRNAGMINGYEGNKIYCNAGAKVFIMTDPIYFESMTGLELIHTDWGEKYGFVMGDSDMTVNYSYTEKPRYNINFTEDTNAAADVQITTQEQLPGHNVYIRFLNGQGSSTIAVTSNDVELTYDQPNDEYYFAMPEHDVNIKAVYKQPTQNYPLLTLSDGNSIYITGYNAEQLPGDNINDWFNVINEAQRTAGMINSDEYNKIYCNAGAKVFLYNNPSDIETITGLELIQTDEGERYGFVMGDSDMTVNYSYTEKPYYAVNFTEDSNAAADVEIDPQQSIAGHNVYIRFLNGQSSSTVAVTSNDVELTYDQPNDEYCFTMPEHEVNIKAVYTQPMYNINFTEDTNASEYVQIDPQQTVAGHKVYIRFLDSQISSKIAVTSNDVELTYDQPNYEYYFTMPEHDVNIKAVYTQPMYNVNFTEDTNAAADVQINPQQTFAGSKVYIRFLNGQSSSTVAVTSTDVELTYDQAINRYYFTMPEHDVNIKAVYTQPIQISIDLGGTDLTCASYDPSGTYYPHAFFVVQVPEGKTTDNYTFVTSDYRHIRVTPVGDHFDVEFKASGTVTFANA